MEDIDDLLRTTEQPAIVKPKPVNPRAQKDPIEESSEDEFIDSEALTVQGRMFSLFWRSNHVRQEGSWSRKPVFRKTVIETGFSAQNLNRYRQGFLKDKF